MRIPMMTDFTQRSLFAVMAAASACVPEDDAPAVDESVSPRCFPNCTVFNSPYIGEHDMSLMAESGPIEFRKTTFEFLALRLDRNNDHDTNDSGEQTTLIDVLPNGTLRAFFDRGGWLSGTQLNGAVLEYMVSPAEAESFTAHVRISGVQCAPGVYDSGTTICKYTLVTDVKSIDEVNYPEIENTGWWRVCPDYEDNGEWGALFHPDVIFEDSAQGMPAFSNAPNSHVIGCMSSAMSKTQYYFQAFYNTNATRGLQASQVNAAIPMWTAGVNNGYGTIVPTTEVGAQIYVKDCVGSLFDNTGGVYGLELEAGYKATGAAQRGVGGGIPAEGLHRTVCEPMNTISGWSSLPGVTAANACTNSAAFAVFIQPSC